MSDRTDLDDRIKRAMERGERFDAFIASALRAAYGESAHWLLEASPDLRTERFVKLVRSSGWYPEDRLPRIIAMLNDLRLQHFLLIEMSGGYNQYLFADKPYTAPDIQLHMAALDQATIGMSRIFAERLMNLLYYLETGKELAGKSKKGKFFRFARSSERWTWLTAFEQLVDAFDSWFRTPEFHSGSMLRKRIEGGAETSSWPLLSAQNLVYGLCSEVEVVLSGGQPSAERVIQRVLPDWATESSEYYIAPWNATEEKWRSLVWGEYRPAGPNEGPEGGSAMESGGAVRERNSHD